MRKWPIYASLVTVGFYVALSLLIPTIIGWLIGIKAHHEILFPLIGLGGGTLIMVYGVCRMLRPFLEEAEWDQRDREQMRQPMRMFLNLLLKQKKGGEK